MAQRLLLGGAKLAGILLERSGDRVVVGFGVNLAAAPAARRPRRPPALGGAITPQAFAPLLAGSFARLLGAVARRASRRLLAQAWLARAHPVGTPLDGPRRRGRDDRAAASTGSNPTARCACGWPTGASRSSAPATSSCEARMPLHRLGQRAMLLAIDAGNTNVVFALVDGGGDQARAGASRPIRAARPTNMRCGCTSCSSSKASPKADVDGGDHRHRRAARAPQSRRCWRRNISRSSRWSPGRARPLADRARRGRAAKRRRRPRAQRHGRACASYPGDLIVIDFGTATTFDVVDLRGAYKGGIIAPGINLSLDALVNAAAKLPRIAIEAPDGRQASIGRTTESQMLIGIYWGYVAMIEGLVARMKAEIGRPVTVIATGGLADPVRQAHQTCSTRSNPTSPSRGLACCYDWRQRGRNDPGRRTAVRRPRRIGRDWHERQSLRLPRQMADGRLRPDLRRP